MHCQVSYVNICVLLHILQMKGEKILSRQRGFTVTTCTAAIAAGEETPSFQGLPTGARVSLLRLPGCFRNRVHTHHASSLKQLACLPTSSHRH